MPCWRHWSEFCPKGISTAVFLGVLLLFPVGAFAGQTGVSYVYLWGGFSTSLVNRSSEQVNNAGRAAMDLNGAIIAPGGVFSFNDLVGARDSGKGYLPAPIITEQGGISDIPGGGICQLATTIYNAALNAGMEIVERHPHSRSVGYVPPGRDATILTWRKDLKLRNPHAVPLLLRLEVGGGRLTVEFRSVISKPFRVKLFSEIVSVDPEVVVAGTAGQARETVQQGGRGFSVVTRRRIERDGEARDEVLSQDFYPPPSRIIAGGEP